MEEFYCTGCNFFGQLGLGYRSRTQPSYIPCKFGENEIERIQRNEIQDIQCGTQFTVLIKTNGEVRTLSIFFFTLHTLLDTFLRYIKWFSLCFININ